MDDAAGLMDSAEEAQVQAEMEAVAQYCNVGCYTYGGSSSADVLDKAETWGRKQFGDAEFTVYFDSGDGYEFEQGQYSLMELKYSEKNHELSISKSGKYPVDDSFDVEYIGRIRN